MIPTLTLAAPDSAVSPPDPGDPRLRVWRDPEGAVCGYGWAGPTGYRIHLPGTGTFSFGEDGPITAAPTPGVPEDRILDAYRRAVLPLVLHTRSQEVLHASGVVTARGVAALCGVSGTGKSTLAYALSRRGYRLWADDALALQVDADGFRALPLPFHIRLRPESAHFFACPDRPADGTGRNAQPASLSVIVALRRTHSRDSPGAGAVRLAPAQAFRSVLAHAFCFDPGEVERKRPMLGHYLLLSAHVPVWEFRFCPGLEHLDSLLGELERILGDPGE